MAVLALAAALAFAPIDSTDYSMVEAVPSATSFRQQLVALGHGAVFRGRAVTLLLALLGSIMLVLHYATELIPPLWLAGLDEHARYEGELRAAYTRERRLQHRQLSQAVGDFFGTYDLLCTVIRVEDAIDAAAGSAAADDGVAGNVLAAPTVPAVVRMMCCPAVTMALLHDDESPGTQRSKGGRRTAAPERGRGQGQLGLMLIGRPYGDDALLAAAAAWEAAHPVSPLGGGGSTLPNSVAKATPAASKSSTGADDDQSESADARAPSVSAAAAAADTAWCAGLGLGLGTRVVGRVICSPGWATMHRALLWGAGVVSGSVSAAYNGQRLNGSHG
jgi:hypothetical protein